MLDRKGERPWQAAPLLVKPFEKEETEAHAER